MTKFNTNNPPAAPSGTKGQQTHGSKTRMKPGMEPERLPTRPTSTVLPFTQTQLRSSSTKKRMWEERGACPKLEWRRTAQKIFAEPNTRRGRDVGAERLINIQYTTSRRGKCSIVLQLCRSRKVFPGHEKLSLSIEVTGAEASQVSYFI